MSQELVDKAFQPLLDSRSKRKLSIKGGRIVAIFLEGGKGECRLGIKKTNSIDWNYGFDAYAPLLSDFSIEKRFIF